MLNPQKKIESVLFDNKFPIDLTNESLLITPLTGGKTSSVFKVELQSRKSAYVVKFYSKNQWQIREAEVYEKYLSKINLHTPKLIFSNISEGILVLEYIKHKPFKNKSYFDRLAHWIVEKYTNTVCIFQDQKLSLDKNIDWMLHKPIKKLLPYQQIINSNVVKILENELYKIYSLDLPVVLDHGDLELQNIIQSEKDMYILDWSNAIKSYGFVDFAQFKKLLREANNLLDYAKFQEKFSKLIKMHKIKYEKTISLYAVVREIQLMAYYMDINIGIDDARVFLSNQILHEELDLLLR